MNTIIALTVLGVCILFLGLFNLKKWILPLASVGLLLALGLSIADWGITRAWFNNMLVTNRFCSAFGSLLVLSTFFVCLMSDLYFKGDLRSNEGLYAVLIFSLIGALVMISASNLVTFFVGLEIMSISLYILAGSNKTSPASNEAAMKYFLMGSFASAFLLFGIALLYGATGSMYYQNIASYSLGSGIQPPLLFKTGILLVALGMAFKVGAVPFHFWVPDVYEGSPTLITSYMITTIKAAGFAAFMRLTIFCFPGGNEVWMYSLAIIAALSIITGNLAAINQLAAKRMLAYSSIAHTGYILLALVALQVNTPSVILYYSAAYIFSNLAAFGVLILLRNSYGNTAIDSLNGLARLSPVAAIAFAVAMLSLTGIPPLAGFMAKYSVFALAIQHGFLWLVIIAILGSVVSIFYYFRPIVNIYMKPPGNVSFVSDTLSTISLLILTFITLVLGFIPGWVMSWI